MALSHVWLGLPGGRFQSDGWMLANRNSNCAVMVFIRSTACDVQPKNLKRRSVAMLESGGHCPDFCIKVRLHFAAVCTTGWTKRFEYSYNK